MSLISIRNPELAHLTDAELHAIESELEQRRKALANSDDNSAAIDAIDAIDAELFAIDDELCARGL